MDFKSYLKVNAKFIDEELDKILSQFLGEAKKTSPKFLPLAKQFINSCHGGKRIRGVLVKLGYEIAEGDKHLGGEISRIGAAWEILHTASLIHDDVIDQSPIRRGQPSLYTALGGNHYGQSQAISLGDIGLYLPVRIISDCLFLEKDKVKALKHLSQTVIQTGLGEVLDVELPHLGKSVKEEDIKILYTLKTAYYTIAGPLIMGAILAEAEKNLIRVLGVFGENLGVAFQIQDDILGVFGSAEQIGKSVTSDIAEGKNTLLYNYSLEKADKDQKQILGQYYGQSSVAEEGLKQIRQVFIKTGALDFAKKEAERYQDEALKVLPEITQDNKMSKILEQMAEYLVQRTK